MSEHQQNTQPGYLRLQEVIRNRTPGYTGPLPMSIPAWYAGMSAGKYPRPIKVGRSSYYRKADIDDLIARIDRGELASIDPVSGSKRGRPRKTEVEAAA